MCAIQGFYQLFGFFEHYNKDFTLSIKTLTIDILELYSIDVFDKIIDVIDHSLILYEEFFGTQLLLQFPSYSPAFKK